MRYIIEGPYTARGEITISGAKNFSIKALAASLLQSGEIKYFNVPDNLDVHKTLGMLTQLGAHTEFDTITKTCTIHTKNAHNILEDSTHANMGIFLLGAALLHRFQHVRFPKNKGCPLGKRLDDFHIMAFEKFGAQCEFDEDGYTIRKYNSLKGCNISLPYPSVGATETILFLAVLADGVTTLHNAAIEPEIQALITMLTTMGAQIFYEEDRKLVIHGVDTLHADTHVQIHGDLLEACSWATLAAITKGEIIVNGVVPELIGSFLGIFNMMGGCVQRISETSLSFSKAEHFIAKNMMLETGVFPTLRTDLQPLLAALATTNKATTIIHETVYDNRVDYVDSFKQFGIDASNFDQCLGKECRFHHKNLKHCAIVNYAENISAPKYPITPRTIRNGMADILLACRAHGKTVIENVDVVERGYCNLFNKLHSVGINITRK